MTTKTILGARVRQQVVVPHGAHHRRILEGEKKRVTRVEGPRHELEAREAKRDVRDFVSALFIYLYLLCVVACCPLAFKLYTFFSPSTVYILFPGLLIYLFIFFQDLRELLLFSLTLSSIRERR